MPAPPGGTPRRSSRRSAPREWSALETPIGFERCVRETLRELYGYVALLAGRDRRGAERHVTEVYRSLFHAARSGAVDAVTLGALRSAARRTWLDDHRDELATVDEVSRAPASTIADLSTLERAVLVLRHVNGMTADRAAAELGRTDREVVAVGAHAVRRLRGTDDTTGAWLRAYLGPTVTPAAGLVDRIIDQLGAVPVDDTSGDEPEETAVTEAADETAEEVEEAVGADPLAVPAPADDDPATTELPVVELPTLELAVVPAAAVAAPLDGPVEPAEPSPASDSAPAEPAPADRPRWVVAIGLALVAALVVALVWLALRGDADGTVVSTPADDATATTDPSVPSDGSAATSTTSAPVTTVAVGPVEVGSDPRCTDRTGAEPVPVSWPATFGPLGDAPVLTVTLPESVDETAGRAASEVASILRPDGLVLAVQPATNDPATNEPATVSSDPTLVTRIGLDGVVAWVRCLEGPVEIGSAPDAGVDLAVRSSGGDWTAMSIADGSPGDPLDPVQSAVVGGQDADGDGDAGGADDGVTIGFSYDRESRRSVLAGLDDGRVVWRLPDLELPTGDTFRAEVVGDAVVARHCPAPPGSDDEASDAVRECAAGELRAYELATGELRWARPDVHRVAATGDGFALVGGAAGWELVDVSDGVAVDGRRWSDRDAFAGLGDPGVTVRREGGALVVTRPGVVEVWLPVEVAGESARVDLS